MATRIAVALKPIVDPSDPPWYALDDGTIFAADGATVCVLGDPLGEMTERDVANGALILAAPALRAELLRVAEILDGMAEDDDDPAAREAAAMRAVAAQAGKLPESEEADADV